LGKLWPNYCTEYQPQWWNMFIYNWKSPVTSSLVLMPQWFLDFAACCMECVIFSSGGLGLQRLRIQALPSLCQWRWMFCPPSAYWIKPSWSEPKIKPNDYPTRVKSPKIFLLVGRALNYTMIGPTFLPIRILKYPTITGIPL
jgi:hypothetical protein